jgi:VCBS repeat-containing protein
VLNIAAAGVLGNDTDADGNTLTAAKVSDPTHGTLTLNSNGSFVYTPSTNYTGTDTCTYRANDGVTNSNTATVTITITAVNSAPVLSAIGNKSITQGQLLTFTVSATDPDGDKLTYSASNMPTGAVFTPATGVFSWTPASGQAGNYPNVHFEVSDGVLTAYANITITVNAQGVYSVSSLFINPRTASPGRNVSIFVLVKKSGTSSGSYSVTCKINGVILATKVVTLSSSSQWVVFTTSRSTPGTYTVDVNGLTGSFLVRSY